MKELIVLGVISGTILFLFLITLILGFAKKSKGLKIIALFILLAFLALAGYTIFTFVNKSYNTVTETLRPRTGEEIYDALFGKRNSDCIKILNYQDQDAPKIDYAIWLHFETCPKELARILAKHKFKAEKLLTHKWNEKYHMVKHWPGSIQKR